MQSHEGTGLSYEEQDALLSYLLRSGGSTHQTPPSRQEQSTQQLHKRSLQLEGSQKQATMQVIPVDMDLPLRFDGDRSTFLWELSPEDHLLTRKHGGEPEEDDLPEVGEQFLIRELQLKEHLLALRFRLPSTRLAPKAPSSRSLLQCVHCGSMCSREASLPFTHLFCTDCGESLSQPKPTGAIVQTSLPRISSSMQTQTDEVEIVPESHAAADQCSDLQRQVDSLRQTRTKLEARIQVLEDQQATESTVTRATKERTESKMLDDRKQFEVQLTQQRASALQAEKLLKEKHLDETQQLKARVASLEAALASKTGECTELGGALRHKEIATVTVGRDVVAAWRQLSIEVNQARQFDM